MSKTDGAFLTIGELAGELGVPQHILRYWETRFPMLKPLQRAGNRRYYRPEDVALARKINHLLNAEGYTVRGAQQVLVGEAGRAARKASEERAIGSREAEPQAETKIPPEAPVADLEREDILRRLLMIRSKLEGAL